MTRSAVEGEAREPLTLGEPGKIIINETEKVSPAGGGFKLKVYRKRWLMLGLYVVYSAGSTYQWVQYSIISNIITRYYGVSSLAVDWTSLTFLLYYVVLIFPASFVADRLGLRWTAIVGSCVSSLGAWIKIFSVAPDRFYVTFIGQSIVASVQVLILTVPARLAAHWFNASKLSTATSIGIFGNQLGIAMGFLLTPVIVKNHADLDEIGHDLSRLFWSVALFNTVGAVLVILLFQDEPKLPPSETRALQKEHRKENTEGFLSLKPLKRLFTNRSYLILCNSYGMNVGVLNAVATLLNQMFLMHFENGERDAGRIGLAIVTTGMFGAVTFGMIVDKTRKYKETTVTVYFLTLCGQILFAVAMCYEIKWMVYASAIFLGFFMSGYLALGYEMCAEYTYPEPEGTATGILNIANNLYGAVLVLVLGKLMETYGDVIGHVGLCTALLAGFVMTVLTKDEQRRQDARRAAQYGTVTAINGDPAKERT